MITNQPNIDYTVKYAKLFEDAIKVLHDEFNVAKDVEQFTSLEEYFMYIGYFAEEHNKIVKNIYESNTTDRSEWNTEFATYSKYLMLPLNEEYFVINANTRAISVPALFASHGVSLDGDYHAETLMFEIDRYFDTKDLICTNIIVQWQSPSGVMGTTPITLVDYDSEKIRFGWTLTDQVVDAKGALTFSVRFIETDSNDNLIYSLNTLATAVKINPALSADLIEKTDESPWLYLNAVSNGANSNSSVKPKYPKIYLDLDAEKDYSLVSDTVSLEVGAYPQDSGSLSYKWIYNHYNNKDYNKEFTTSGNYYILTTDSEKNASKTYYTRQKDDTTGEYVYSECTAASFTDGKFTSGVQYYEKNIIVEIKYEKSGDQKAEEGKFYYIEKTGGGYELLSDLTKFEVGKVFEKHVKLTICPSSNNNIAGQYHVNVINTIKGNKKTMASAKATIPAITEIAFKNDLVAAGSNNILEAKVETDEDGETTTSYSKQLKVEQQEGLNTNCQVKYQWRSKKKESDEFANIINATTATYNATEPGWYQVRLTGELNRTEAFKDSIVAKITKPTEAPVVTKTGKPVTYELANGKTQVIEVKATVGDGVLDPDLVSDKVEYKWQYQIPEVNPPQYADAVVGEHGVVSIDANKITVKFDGGEVFKCIVTNTLNDTSQSVESDKYWITGADV